MATPINDQRRKLSKQSSLPPDFKLTINVRPPSPDPNRKDLDSGMHSHLFLLITTQGAPHQNTKNTHGGNRRQTEQIRVTESMGVLRLFVRLCRVSAEV